jgi:hypothetical protein
MKLKTSRDALLKAVSLAGSTVNGGERMPMAKFHRLGGIAALFGESAKFKRGAFRFFSEVPGSLRQCKPEWSDWRI